jgi:hypothetical protein
MGLREDLFLARKATRMVLPLYHWYALVRHEAYRCYLWMEPRRAEKQLGPRAPESEVRARAHQIWLGRKDESAKADWAAGKDLAGEAQLILEDSCE